MLQDRAFSIEMALTLKDKFMKITIKCDLIRYISALETKLYI